MLTDTLNSQQEHSGQAGLIPLDTELWLDELLSRIFTILENLEAPETRSETAAGRGSYKNGLGGAAGSFLLDKTSMFRCNSQAIQLGIVGCGYAATNPLNQVYMVSARSLDPCSYLTSVHLRRLHVLVKELS